MGEENLESNYKSALKGYELEHKGNATTLVLTYNDISGYPAGVYHGRSRDVVVHSQDRRYYQESPEKLSELLHSLYSKVDMQSVDSVIVYAGLNALEGALGAAKKLAHDKKDVRLVACDCQYLAKKQFSDRNGIQIEFCECGGARTLSKIVNDLLKK